MKIAYDGKRFFNNASGLGNYSRDLVRILATFFPENQYLLINDKKSGRGAETLSLPQVGFIENNGSFARQLSAGKAAQKMGAEIYHGLSGELPLRWDTDKKIKKIVTIHDLIFLRLPQYYSALDRKIHYWKFKKAANEADLVIAISEQTKRDIVQFLKIPEGKIKVVYQGCAREFKESLNQDLAQKITEKYKLPKKFILTVGTLEPRKNVLNILKALSDTEIPLVAVGKKQKQYFGRLQKFIKKNKFSAGVIFIYDADLQTVATLYKMAEIFIYPSFFEGFGIPIIEALFSGTPVITSNTSSLPEAGGDAALYINPESPRDISAKVRFLWENEAERKLRTELGLRHAENFTDEKIAEKLIVIYKNLLGTSFGNSASGQQSQKL